jgi:TonB family protein
MSYQFSPYINRDVGKGIPFGTVIVISIIFHGVFLVGLPLLGYFFWKPKVFDRPKTFQLVNLPLQPNVPKKAIVPKDSPKQKVAQNKPEPAKVPGPVPKEVSKEKPPSKNDPAQNDQSLDELASLLDEIPAPAQVAAVGDFKYPWYLTNVQNKIQRFWNPPTENKKLKVVIAFTIFSDGTISEPKIFKSCGDLSIDNLAIRAVRLAAPFGKLSVGFNAKSVDINVTLNPTRN